ncbi:MAG: class I SAM-dependent methyltransferase [Parachlamydiaceae bacterium]
MPYREDIPGYMPKKDLEVIENLAGCLPENSCMVEVGSYYGRSSWAWAKSVPSSCIVYCIDPWPHSDLVQGIFDASLDDFESYLKDCPNVIPVQGLSPHIPWDDKQFVDLVFIDGNHFSPHVNDDLECWAKRLTPSGILSGHDFNPTRYPDVCEAVIALSKELRWPLRLFSNSTIWYLERGKEPLSSHNRRIVAQRLIVESMCWQPNEAQMEAIRHVYQKHA